MFRSEALRTRYIIRSEEPWPVDVHGSRHGSQCGKALPERPQIMRQPIGLAKWLTQSPLLDARKPHASTVDRRDLLMDSLEAGREMAARTNGMGLARIETEIVRKLDG